MSALSAQNHGQTFSEATLRIATAGSVDDGKSTLIGRLLYDTGSLPSDKIEEIRRRSKRMGYDYLDFSLATDGLEIEREQGITIDVAYIYFSTPTKNYIIADTPGHEEYTRNMVTGASVSEAAVVVVDARKGVLAQTRRHFFINSLLRVKDIIVAVNKMDLVEYSQDVFDRIAHDIAKIAQEYAPHGSAAPRIVCIPVSALRGENVARRTSDETAPKNIQQNIQNNAQNNMGWYEGPTLLEHLESLSDSDIYDKTPLRFAVQCAIRPKNEDFRDFRAYAGKVYGCPVREGDAVVVLPAGHRTTVREIYCGDARVSAAHPGTSAALVLDGEFNIVRGDLIASADAPLPCVASRIRANVCWFDAAELSVSKQYIVQHARRRTNARIAEFHGAVFAHGDSTAAGDALSSRADGSLRMNEIGSYSFELQTPLCCDLYRKNKHTGVFIIIDPQSFTTAGVGFITDDDEKKSRVGTQATGGAT